MTVHITTEEVAHVAKLARLSFSSVEIEELTSQLAAVLAHAEDIENLDVSEVEMDSSSYPWSSVNVMRADEPRGSLERDEVLSQAPSVADGRFKVPPVLVGEPS